MRPFIICHMATSIDGRLHPSRFTSPAAEISADTSARHYEEVAGRFGADGSIVGRKTMSELAKGRNGPLRAPLSRHANPMSAIGRIGSWRSPSIRQDVSTMLRTTSAAITS
jgi:hypothetical protein